MDGIASVSGVGTVASRVSFTASTSPGETSGTDVQGDVNTVALKLILAAPQGRGAPITILARSQIVPRRHRLYLYAESRIERDS